MHYRNPFTHLGAGPQTPQQSARTKAAPCGAGVSCGFCSHEPAAVLTGAAGAVEASPPVLGTREAEVEPALLDRRRRRTVIRPEGWRPSLVLALKSTYVVCHARRRAALSQIRRGSRRRSGRDLVRASAQGGCGSRNHSPPVHDDRDTARWIAQRVIAALDCWVAETSSGAPAGLLGCRWNRGHRTRWRRQVSAGRVVRARMMS